VTTLTTTETGEIISRIEPDLVRFVREYDESKYPPLELARLRRAFSKPETVAEADIVAALVWKYGNTGKANYPRRQYALAKRISAAWSANAIVPGAPPLAAFDRWRSLLGSTSFITVCFLLHLANPNDLPILDQHNFRSVNRHLADVRPGFVTKAKPSRFEDLLLVRDFGAALTRDWNRHSPSPPPHSDTLDRYLMMHGKSLKVFPRVAQPRRLTGRHGR
jgi:hypothetical protein